MKIIVQASALSLLLISAEGFTLNHGVSRQKSRTSSLFFENEEVSTAVGGGEYTFDSPVLKQVYPKLLDWKEKYGHPNIPLGSSEGRQCQTLRRLHIQQKLTAAEIEWLDSLGFIFHSLEDVYQDVSFEELFGRMMEYEARHPESNFQIPKKCPEDPELGAWVTGIRRLGPDGVDPEHAQKLNEVGFAWVSTRKCGSKFMLRYKELVQQVEEQGVDKVLNDPQTIKWIQAQQEVVKRGAMSQTRIHYLEELFGKDWTSIE
eukprot:scaffold4095_cov117-Cylindrotheca_fusiformis.AAC.15